MIKRNLRKNDLGIWVGEKIKNVAYPQDGNARCFDLEGHSFWFKHRNDCILSAVKRFPPSGFILDVGGGNGFVTRRLLNEGFEAVLLEPGPEGCLNARIRRGIPDVICSTLDALQITKGTINAVGMFDVLEHVEHDGEMFQNVYDVLKQGGLFYLTVPAFEFLWSQSDDNAMHFRRYSRKLIEDVMANRFEICYFSYFFAMLFLPVFIFRTLPYSMFSVKRKNTLSPETEHGIRQSRMVQALERLLALEAKWIAQGRSLSMGTSCIVVARKF
jgi:SAM-dependent methyltransferase